MKTIVIIIVILSSLHLKAQENQSKTLISNITIISANTDSIKTQVGYVSIEGEKIVSIGDKKPEGIGNYIELDGTGKYLIPGLIDSHVHLANIAGLNGPLKKKYPEVVELYFDQLPKSYLYFGFTTLIDVNNYWPERINKILSAELRPDIYTCGEQVTVMDDFNMEMEEYSQGQRYVSNFLNDNYNANSILPDSIQASEHTPQKIVAKIREQQGICAKLVYEDEASGLAVSWEKPTASILRDLILEAQRFNMPLVLHAPSLEGHKIGLETGIQIFAHGMWNWSDDPNQFNNPNLGDEHKRALLEIAEKQIPYQLTFRTITGEKDLVTMDFLEDKNLEHVFPKQMLDLLNTEEGQWGKRKIFGRTAFLEKTNPPFYKALKADFTDDQKMWEHVFKTYKHRLNTVARFLGENDANLILGTDSPAMNMYTNPPGYNGILEMRHWADTGIPLEKIFRAATFNNAHAFHLEHLYGSVEKGSIANLLILNSNPLKTVEAYNDIEKVMIRGKLIVREQLSALAN
ncbi:MAG: amidohydrolase family protein [Maribacter sp.]|nr:amidohydrolase family protein [Maribacter sp.]